ncbi:putative sas10 utp3 family protein [Erysiphe necator]|uniref:Putative sas10 utp3 family protein n=1 Tax=Uncinula necator TaxID=52586 RepID=A0A0B1P9R1_UNCNE|nr:putative sas10 utp3 family protein [Erysiphe necator]
MGTKRKLTTVNFTDKPKTRKIAKNEKLYTNSTFEDFAGSEDEFHINRDKISFDGRLESSKNKRWQQDESLELSDNEIFPYPESDSEEDQGLSTIGPDVAVHDAPEMMRIVDEDINKDIEEWDASKQEYYNHDLIETEAEALEEEAEAKRLQQKKLSKMSAVDFDIEEDNDLDNHKEKGTGNVVTEVLQNFVISADMQPEERQRILHLRYPEFDPLANDLLELYPVLQKLQVEVENESSSLTSSNSPTTLKFRALSAYVGTLTMYFAIISSPGFGSSGEAHALNPEELREHSIMDTLLQCRELWSKVKNYSISTALTINPAENYSYEVSEELPQESVDLKKKIKDSIQSNISAKNKEKSKIAEDELQKLNKLIKFPFQMKVKNKLRPTSINEDSDGSDFGEEDSIDAKLAIEKANNKRSLRFYTSKITQKASKRVDAGKNAGGDEDIPHRERLRDRQARLNSEAQRRALQKNDMDLGVQSESDEDKIALQVREAGNDYYDQITRAKNLKKDQKLARKQAEAQANLEGGWVRVVESEVGNDGKRAIGYVIEKNKGLAPKRKKDVRNPRVKKRKKYEEKKKKLASTRAIYKGGEERGGYGGEKTGIKTRLVKSIKL